MSALARDAIVNGLIKGLAGTTGVDGTAQFHLYTFAGVDGTMPTSADDGTVGTLLCSFGTVNWSAGTGGTGALYTTAFGTAHAFGTVGWGRFRTTQGDGSTICLDGTVGTGGSNAFVVNSEVIAVGGVVTLTSANLTVSGY